MNWNGLGRKQSQPNQGTGGTGKLQNRIVDVLDVIPTKHLQEYKFR